MFSKYRSFVISTNHYLKGGILLYHFLITYFSYHFILYNKADAKGYWFLSKSSDIFINDAPMPFRENLLFYINYFLAHILELPLWAGMLLYSMIGLVGIYLFLRSIVSINKSYSMLFLYVILLPSMHFWTSLIGKEPLVFLAISIVFYTLLHNKSIHMLVIGFIVLMLIRPHVAIILGLAIAIAYTINKKRINLSLVGGFLFISLLSLYILLNSHWLGGLSISNLQHLFQTHHEAFSKTNSYVPLEEYNIFYKIFTFYFRPFPFEFNTTMGWLMSIENMISLAITIVGIYAIIQLIFKYHYKLTIVELSIILFFILLAVVLTLAYSNFGLISRMKNQCQPFMLLLCLHWIILYRNKRLL